MGLLDMFNDPQSAGLLGAGAQILERSGDTSRPYGIGQALGTGISSYMQINNSMRARKQQEEEQAQQQAMREMQMRQAQQQQSEQDQINEAARTSMSGGALDPKAFVSRVMQISPMKGMELERQLAKAAPEFSTDVKTGRDADGKTFSYVMDKGGNMKRLDGVMPRDEAKLMNLGGKEVAYNPFDLQQGQEFKRTQTPDSIASNANAAASRAQSERHFQANFGLARDKADPTTKPMPATALKMQQGELDAIGTASGINAQLDKTMAQLEGGNLKLGMVSNAMGQAMNYTGMSTENSRNLASFKANLEKMRNDSLRLNAGVQTDGDAQRAWNEVLTNINDGDLVKQRLSEIKNLNARAVQLRKMNVDGIRANYGRDAMDTSAYEAKPAEQPKAAGAEARNPPLRKYNPKTGKIE